MANVTSDVACCSGQIKQDLSISNAHLPFPISGTLFLRTILADSLTLPPVGRACGSGAIPSATKNLITIHQASLAGAGGGGGALASKDGEGKDNALLVSPLRVEGWSGWGAQGLARRPTCRRDVVVKWRSWAAVHGGGWRRSRPVGRRVVAVVPSPWPSLPAVVIDLLCHYIVRLRAGVAARVVLDLPAFPGGSGGWCSPVA
jgi:hypothetical protein